MILPTLVLLRSGRVFGPVVPVFGRRGSSAAGGASVLLKVVSSWCVQAANVTDGGRRCREEPEQAGGTTGPAIHRIQLPRKSPRLLIVNVWLNGDTFTSLQYENL